MSEISRNNLPNDKQYCGVKTKQGICKNLPMENGRCRLHGGLTPKKHPNHKARFNALKDGRYSKESFRQIQKIKAELKSLDEMILQANQKGY